LVNVKKRRNLHRPELRTDAGHAEIGAGYVAWEIAIKQSTSWRDGPSCRSQRLRGIA
jgi:hypothetical protein